VPKVIVNTIRSSDSRSRQFTDWNEYQQSDVSYWLALEAPRERIARALCLSPRDVGEIASLVRRTTADPKPSASSKPSEAPAGSAYPWAKRVFHTLAAAAFNRDADDTMVVLPGEGALSAGEIRSLVARTCRGLYELDVGKGSFVAVDAAPRLETYLVTAASLLVGAIVVRLGETVAPSLLRQMAAAAPAAATFSARFAELGRIDVGARIGLGDHGGGTMFHDWIAGLDEAEIEPLLERPPVTPDDAAFVGFTSGSTGQPKAMLTSHEAIFRSTEVAQQHFSFSAADVFLTSTDFTALSAFRSMMTLPFISGGQTVLPSATARSQPLALAFECEDHGVTRLTAVPSVLRNIGKAGDLLAGQLRKVKTFLSGSGVLDAETAGLLRRRFGAQVVDYYGGREFATAAYSDPDAEGTMSQGGGKVVGCLVRIVDGEGRSVDRGVPGEIVVHSDCLTPSNLPSIPTAGPLAGWHHTGDVGKLNADGRLEVLGRLKDVIKAADGELVNPAMIEGVINTLSWVKEASVTSWLDETQLERIGAAVVTDPATAPADRQLATQLIRGRVFEEFGGLKTPSTVLLLDELPRVGRGKPDKRKLRQLLATAARQDSESRT
jgi:acyl-coenzyme A synthetase/AMP-(fatty) acid ligase